MHEAVRAALKAAKLDKQECKLAKLANPPDGKAAARERVAAGTLETTEANDDTAAYAQLEAKQSDAPGILHNSIFRYNVFHKVVSVIVGVSIVTLFFVPL